MTLFTVIWGVLLLIAFISKDIKKMLCVTLLSMMFQCDNFLQFENLRFGPQILASLLFIVKYFLTLSKGKITIVKESRFIFINLLMLLLIIISIMSSYINGVFSSNYLYIIQLIIYFGCYLCMRKVFQSLSDEDVYKIVRRIIIFVVIVGIIQLIVTNFAPFLRIILKPLFYNDKSMNVYFNYNDAYHNKRIYSLFMEPSYFAGLLVGGFYYLLSFSKLFKKNALLITVILIEIIITASSTAYVAFVIIGVIYIIYSKQITLKWKLFIIVFGSIIIGIMYYFFYDLLDTVIFSKSQSGSGITRARWNMEALAEYKKSQIIGSGYKNVRGSSIVYSLLGELGILGLTMYFLFHIASLYKFFFQKTKNKLSNGYYGAMAGVLAVIICQVIACPDLDLCTFWFWLYVLALYEGLFIKSKHYGGETNG